MAEIGQNSTDVRSQSENDRLIPNLEAGIQIPTYAETGNVDTEDVDTEEANENHNQRRTLAYKIFSGARNGNLN